MKLFWLLETSLWWYVCIRGYALFSDLSWASQARWYQRELLPDHTQEIQEYISKQEDLFFPEVILWCTLKYDFTKLKAKSWIKPLYDIVNGWGFQSNIDAIKFGIKKFKNAWLENIFVTVDINSENLLSRIDGNHRLSAYEREVYGSAIDIKIPFCLILFEDNVDWDASQKIIFHNINYKNKPITSDHAIKVILELPKSDQELFEKDQELFFVKKINQKVEQFADNNMIMLLWDDKYSKILELVRFLLKTYTIWNDLATCISQIDKIFSEFNTLFCRGKQEWLDLIDYYEIIPACFSIFDKEANPLKQKELLQGYNNRLWSYCLWTNFPNMEYILFEVYYASRSSVAGTYLTRAPYIDWSYLKALRSLELTSFNTKKLLTLCDELNHAYKHEMYYTCAILQRAIIDHVPPMFGESKFESVVAQAWKSKKSIYNRLNQQTKQFADMCVHEQISTKKLLISGTEIDSSKQDFNILIADLIWSIWSS